jgi:DNA-binding IclR family transcriptional regulator
MAQGQTAYVVVRALGVLASEPQSVPSLAEAIDIGPRSARLILSALAGLRLVERVPDDPIRQRHRIAERGRELGGFLLLARQSVEPHRRSDPNGAKERGHAVRSVALALRAIAEEPRASPQIAEHLRIGEKSARLLVAAFTRLRLIERVPDDPIRRRQRITARGQEFGARLVLAKQDVEPYRLTQRGPRNRRTT